MSQEAGTTVPSNLFSDHFFQTKVVKNGAVVDLDIKKKWSSSGDNYMSTIYSVRVNVEKEDGEGEEECHLVLKALPTNPPMLKYIRELKAFEKEAIMFNNVFPELAQGVGGGEVESVPKCLHAHSDGEDACIVLEDLGELGYKMVDRAKGLDFKHATLAIKKMAHFHALSFLKFHGNGDAILERFPELVDMFWVEPDKVTERNRRFINGQLEGVKQVMIDSSKAHIIPRIERHFSDVFQRMHSQASAPQNFPSVINLGDCWTNNMMFIYDANGEVSDVKFLDFQLARVTSRCSDLSYLLFTSVAIPVLNTKFMEFLEIYNDEFNSFVTSHCTTEAPPETLLTFQGQTLNWEYLNMEFEQYRSHGTTLALIYTPLMLPPEEAVPDLDKIAGKDLENMGTDQDSNFAKVWKSTVVRDKLIAIASGHLPMCFKPAQPPVE